MTRMRVRALCLAFVLAVCATGATAEEMEVSDVIGAPVMLPKTATSAPVVQANLLGEGEAQPEVQANIVTLQKQNAEALARIKALQDEETVHREGTAAASETDQKREKAQAEAEEAENKKQAQQEYVKQVEKKMQNADAATQIMQQIMELTTSSQKQIADLRKKLKKATNQEAAQGAAEAEQAQQKAVDDAKEEASALQNKIRELVLCKACPGKAQHLSELQDKLTAAKKSEEKQTAQLKSLEVASKASVQKAANAKVKVLEDEKKAAAEKLDDLETQVETKSSEEATMGLHAVKLDKSKNDAVASAMTHQEAKVAMVSKEKSEKKLLEAKTKLIHLIERRIKKEDKVAEAKAAAVAKAKTDKIVGKIENKVRNLQGSYQAQKDSVEAESKKLKSLALTAAAHGDVMNLVKAQGKTTKLLAGLQKTFKQLGTEKQALSEAQEWGLGQLMDAQAAAKKKTTDAMDSAKKLAEKETTPQLDQRISNALEGQKRADDEITRTVANIKSTINTVAKVVATTAETAAVAEGVSQEQMKEAAAKEQEAALKQKSNGVQSPQEAAKMAKKMELIQQTLAAADDAISHAHVKAEHVGQIVDAIAKQALAPGNDPLDLAQQMIGEITSNMRSMTVMVSQAAERKLTNTMVTKLNMAMSSLKAQKEQLDEAIATVNAAEVKKTEAIRTEKKAKLALQFRRAIEKVDKMHEKALEQDKKVEKIRKNMLAVDQKMANEISKHWQKTMEDKISGPSVQELQKQRTELNVKIKLAQQKKEEETAAVDKITEANAALDRTEAMMKKLNADMKDQQAKIDKLPANSAEQIDALRTMDEMEKKELKVEGEVDEDKAKAKDADSLSPQLKAVESSITKFNSRLTELQKQKGQLAALLQTREIAMKTAGDDLEKQKRTADAVVKTKENIVKVADDMKKYDNLKSIALTEKAAVDRTIKKAQDEMAREKQEKLDTKNKWVQDMVHYAQVEKAMKKVGGQESEKHLKRITQKNDHEEIGYKHEVAVKKEKQQKAEEKKDKSEKRLKLSEKEKADKLKEKEGKQEMTDKEKTHKEGIKGELKNKKEEERLAKLNLAKEQKEKGAAAAQKEEREAKALKQKSEAFNLAKENAEKGEKEFIDAKDAELAGRTASEVTKKSAIKKIKDDVANAPAANEAAMKDGQASLIKEAEAAEVATKKKLEDAKNAANDKFSASKKEVVTGQEAKDKAEVKEAKAKAAEQQIAQEIEEKDRMEKDKKESTQKSVEAATKKEVETKSDQEAATKKHSKVSKAFTAAAHRLKITEDAVESVQSRYDENQEKFEVFAKTRASAEQANAKKELADADQELRKDEMLYKNSETPEEELHFNDQVQLDRQILKVKREIAERDGNLVKTEKAEKLVAMDKLEQVTNAEKKAKLDADRANKDLEKAQKNEVGFKVSNKRLQTNKELREKDLQQATEASELADGLVKGASNEKSFKEKKAAAAAAARNKDERKVKMDEAESISHNQGTELEKSSKEGGVKEKAAKFAFDTARSAEVSAANEASSEAVAKMSARQNAASAHLLQVKSDSAKRVLYFQKFEEKAMKNIQSANTKKGFAKRMAEEKEEKNEVKDAKLMGERAEKGASDELARKTDDKDLWKQLNEIKAKMEARRQTAMELSNKAGDTAREQIREDKKERDTEDKKNQANEKELKALAASGTNKTDVAVQNPEEKEKPIVEPDEKNPDLDEAVKKDHSVKPTDNPMVKAAANFSSPYTAMAAEEKDSMRRRRSWHRRRRWVARRRSTAEKKTEKQKLEQVQGKEEDKSITPKGFAGTFWAGVTGVQNLGDAITKVGTMAVTKKETIDSIKYKSTPGYWIGLDSRFQNNFVARFRGYINVPANGTYTFFCIADDGANVYVNGEVVVKNDGMKKQEEQQEGKVQLQTGLADVVVDYFCESGHCGLQVDWEGPGLEREPLSEKHIHQPKAKEEELGEIQMGAGDEDTRELGASSVVSLDDA